jgi:hypothetical protein
MIQNNLEHLWRKIVFIKGVLIVTCAATVFSIVSGAVVGVALWRGAFDLSRHIRQQAEADRTVFQVQKGLEGLGGSLNGSPGGIAAVRAWDGANEGLRSLGIIDQASDDSVFAAAARRQAWVSEMTQRLNEHRNQRLDQTLQLANRESLLRKLVVWTAVLTVLFGFCVPVMALTGLLWLLRKAQKQLVATARELVSDFVAKVDAHSVDGNGAPRDPFRHPRFWLEVVLLATTHVGRQSRHPLWILSSELALLVQTELDHQR